ncbi:MAG: N-ethylammeline chlorohydrolase [Firmicutes bacterium HGW-Firmicutes-13]|nr:MAG: N-ethylammeline chlorohydrolase [Firmicutes bacterium HGW-Firmicutes-13]
MNKLRIKNCTIFTMNEKQEKFQVGEIIIEDDKISYIGQVREDVQDSEFTRVVEAGGMLCLPGFINTHTHAAMTLFRGFADDLPLMTWLETKIWPLEDRLNEEDVYWGTLLAVIEMIKSGTTTFNDMYFFMEAVAEAVKETGIRGVLSRGLIGLQGKGEIGLEETESFISRWHNTCEGRVKVMFGPHAPYTCPPDYLKQVLLKVDQYKLPVHIHLAETKFEVEQCKEDYKLTPIELVDSLGVFEYPTIAAHCVHLTENDMAILAGKGVKVAHNPGSNLKLASGFAPVKQMLEAGITVSIGTDSAASNNNLDMLEEIRLAALIHKAVNEEPTVIPAYNAVEMATVCGAKSLFMENEIGMLKTGYKADLILLNLNKPHLYPQHDPAAHLVYSAQSSDVETVIINGKIIMENRELAFIDEEKIMYNAQKQAFDLIKR